MHLYRYTPAIIGDSYGITGIDTDHYLITVTSHGLIDTVVYDLMDQVMQAFNTGGTDIHPRPFPYCLKAFQYLYALCTIIYIIPVIHSKILHLRLVFSSSFSPEYLMKSWKNRLSLLLK